MRTRGWLVAYAFVEARVVYLLPPSPPYLPPPSGSPTAVAPMDTTICCPEEYVVNEWSIA